MFLKIRRPSNEEMDDLEVFELTSPQEFIPIHTENIQMRTKNKKYKQYIGGITMEAWRNRLALDPEDVIRNTFEATTQMAMNV